MGEAAKISLNAIGKQDTYLLSKDPEDSFFQYNTKQHSEFRKYHRSRNVIRNSNIKQWPFGQTIKVQFNPTNMGDLLSNMYLSIDMPAITDGNYADQLGRHILKSVTMFVDDIEVEKIHDDWGVIYDELYLETSEKVANRFLVNRGLPFDGSDDLENRARTSSKMVVPLQFFFSRKFASDEYASNKPNRPYFPLCAIHRQKIVFELEFHNQAFFTNTTDTLTVNSFNLITEEITITPEERKYFAIEKHTLSTEVVRKHPSIFSDLSIEKIVNQLVPNNPVKSFHWFLRKVEYEDITDATGASNTNGERLFQNRFNFSSNVNYNDQASFFHPIMDSASFYIGGTRYPNTTQTNHTFYKYLIPFRSRLSRPLRNIYTYSFSMNPVNVEPSGSLDFTNIQSDKTTIEVQLDKSKIDIQSNVVSLNMYYTGYQTFTFEAGIMSQLY